MPSINRTRHLTRIAAAAASLAVVASACGGGGVETGPEEGGEEQSVTIGLIQWDEAIAVTNVWQTILEEKGYDVTVEDVEVAPMFQGVSQGDIDVFMDAWLPDTHGEYWDEYGDQIEDVGTWYDGATLHLTVPEYVDEVDSIEDLPDNADLFGGEIVGIEAGSGLVQRTQNDVIPDYGLEDDYELVESSTPAMLSELESAIAEEEPVLVTLWRPHIAYVNHDLKDLEDPEGALGEGEEIHTVAREGFADDYSELNGWLENFNLSAEELESLEEVIINEYSDDQAEGARTWLNDNPEFVERTLDEDAEGLDFSS
ncbi:glycine betaine/proline transport system substrate-binding protein [Lipingzhangella halophila]|uniref:Glycine betaine/proline transport system substrate-binding protein n=1 Tax=Lipingzhangella halophila TaxID=1783352 RepID=A0A7W7RK33_9ACTN|nr:glycine betaine/proline transport system substrate-binding protein [Lipingzhangella halophila]